MIAFESSSAPIAPGFTAPRNRREWLGYAAFDAEQYTMREVDSKPIQYEIPLSDDGQRVDFLTSTHGAPSLIRIRSRELVLADTAELNEDDSRNPDAERDTGEIDADEAVIDTLTIALAEGLEDGLYFDENRLPQPTPGAVFSIPLEELKISPVTREFEVKGYRDRITVMLVTAQPSSDAEMNLDRKPIRRTATLVDRSEPKPGTTTGVTRYLLMVRRFGPRQYSWAGTPSVGAIAQLSQARKSLSIRRWSADRTAALNSPNDDNQDNQ